MFHERQNNAVKNAAMSRGRRLISYAEKFLLRINRVVAPYFYHLAAFEGYRERINLNRDSVVP